MTVVMEAVSLDNMLLPVEILEKVFCLLPPQDLKSAVRVCRWWREVGEAPRFWTWACFKVDCHLYSAPILREMFASRRLHSVKKRLKVRSDFGVRSNEVAVLEVLLPAVAGRPGLLESLDLGGLSGLGGPDYDHAIKLYEVDANVLAQAVIHLVEVDFSNRSYLNQTLGLVFNEIHKKHLNAIFAALLDNSSLLKRLKMYCVDLSFVDEQIMARVINKLEEVDLTGADMTSQQATALFTLMIKNSNLKKFNLGTVWRTGPTPIDGVNPDLLAKALTHLEEVKLPPPLNSKHAKAIFATLDASHGRLKRLDISGNRSTYNHNDLSSVDAALIGNVVNKMETVDIRYTNLTVPQITAILTQSLVATSLKKILIVGDETGKFRRQTKKMTKLLARAMQVIPITDFREPNH